MKLKNYSESIVIPEGVTLSINNTLVKVTGKKGDVERNFNYPGFVLTSENNEFKISCASASKVQIKIMRTYFAHLKNMFKGSMEGHEYKLKICSGHFPMNVSLKGTELKVKNFIGEAVPRVLKIKDGAKIKIAAPEIVVTGINKETVAQTAADIENLCKRPGFDTRIFQDGIYITEKDGKKL